MGDTAGTGDDLERLAEDWIALWQSEIAGWAADPEAAEAWSAWAALGAAWLRAMAAAAAPAARRPPPMPPGFAFGASRGTARPDDGTAPPPRPAAAAAAPGDGGDARPGGHREPRPAAPPDGADAAERAAMAARLAELERRLADLERGPGGNPPDRRRARRRTPRA